MMKKGKDSLRRYQQPHRVGNNNKAVKKGLFKRWSRRALDEKDAFSTEGADGSLAGSSDDNESSEPTQPIYNNNDSGSNWETPSHAQDDPPFSPTATVEKQALSTCSGHSSQSDSPIGVDQFPIQEEGDGVESDEGSHDTLRTRTTNRRGVSNYFDASCAVMPLPFGQEERVPEVTRQTSRRYQPQFQNERYIPDTGPPLTSAGQTPPITMNIKPNAAAERNEQQAIEPQQQQQRQHSARDVTKPDHDVDIRRRDLRKRNSLEDVLKGERKVTIADRRPSAPSLPFTRQPDQAWQDGRRQSMPSLPFTREPTVIESIQEEEEFYARGRTLLREPVIPAYVDSRNQRSLSPATLDTRLQSTVDSRTIDTRLQSTIDTRSTRFSTNSRKSAIATNKPTPKPIPEDPNAIIMIPIQPGVKVQLRRAPEVQAALRTKFYDTPNCPCCERQLAVIADAAFLYCPLCKEISPLFGNTRPLGTKYSEEPEYLRFGLGLGMTWGTLKKVYAELEYDMR